jgi:alpha-glucosidase (family GH31 glycosyl hydrolase)
VNALNISLDNIGASSVPARLDRVVRRGTIAIAETSDAAVELAVFDPGIIRVCWRPNTTWENEPTQTIATAHLRARKWRHDRRRSQLTAGKLAVRLDRSPLRCAFLSDQRNLIRESDHHPLGYFDATIAITWQLESGEAVYGLGAAAGTPLNRVGSLRAMAAMHRGGAGGDLPIPFLVSSRGYGLVVDNSNVAEFDLRHKGRVTFTASDGYLVYFVLTGPTLRNVLAQYAMLTGRSPVPPRWAFGPMFSRIPGGNASGYRSSRELLALAQRLRKKNIPADVLILDYQWDDWIGAFRWNRKRFPDPRRLLSRLARMGFATIVQLKPAINLRAPTAKRLAESGLLLRRRDGSIHTCNYHRGRSAFLDMDLPATRDWYGKQLANLLGDGVSGWWTDEGEWLGFEAHCARDLERSAGGMRNTYNNAWCDVLDDGHRQATDKRVFNITRSGKSGIQRYGTAIWSGDVSATWEGLAEQVTLALQAGMSGVPFWSSDGGGFLGQPSPELYTRWAQFATFSSLTRFHGTGPREPWCFGRRAERIVRDMLQWRMRLMPYIYAAARQAYDNGVPMMRPLALVAPTEPRLAGDTRAYSFGDALLVRPVTQPLARIRREGGRVGVPLLPGHWFDFWTGRRLGQSHKLRNVPVDCPLSVIPVCVRAPAIVVLAEPALSTRSQSWDRLTIRIYAGDLRERWTTSASVYEDDGETRAYARGLSACTRIRAGYHPVKGILLRVEGAKGDLGCALAERYWTLKLYGVAERLDLVYDRQLCRMQRVGESWAAGPFLGSSKHGLTISARPHEVRRS